MTVIVTTKLIETGSDDGLEKLGWKDGLRNLKTRRTKRLKTIVLRNSKQLECKYTEAEARGYSVKLPRLVFSFSYFHFRFLIRLQLNWSKGRNICIPYC